MSLLLMSPGHVKNFYPSSKSTMAHYANNYKSHDIVVSLCCVSFLGETIII